jgi:CheY-like chemotaxis protein
MLAEVIAPGAQLTIKGSGQRKCILIVEDDIDNRDGLAFLLRHEGYRVFTAENGEDALRLLQMMLPDLILLDLVMPTMDGRQFRRRLLADRRLADIPVVVVSGADATSDDAEKLEVSDYLSKTAGIARLLQTVEAHCG